MTGAEEGSAGAWRAWGALAAITILAAGLRVGGMFTEFWLDEIWSWLLAWDTGHSPVRKSLDVFTRLYHDNNHWLNTLWIRWMGEQPWWGYRLLSLVTGCALVPVVGLIGKRDGRAVGVVAAAMSGACYLLVHYSSEARGYAPAAFFAVACFYLMQGELRGRPVWWRGLLFGVSATLGFMSHLTFLYAYVGFIAWWVAARLPRDMVWRSLPAEFALWQGIPVVVVGWLWWVNIRRIPIMGIGTVRPFRDGLAETVAWVLGTPREGVLVWVVAAIAVAAFVAGLVTMGREGSREWVFYLIGVAVAPVVGLVAHPPEAFYPRYLLVSVPFFLIVLAKVGVTCARVGKRGRAVALMALALFLAGNGVWVTRFLMEGRGHYREALSYMASGTRGEQVTVSSDHQFRNGMTMWFYATHWSPGKEIHYVSPGRNEPAPEWFVLHRFVGEPDPPEWITPGGILYQRERRFGYAGASGWTWWVYHAAGR